MQSMGWPVLKDAAFAELRDRFVAGEATVADVLAHVQQIGIWAKVGYTHGRSPRFVAKPVPVEAKGAD